MTNTERPHTNYGWLALIWLSTACGGLAGSASESVEHAELAVTLSGLDRCEPGRLASTVLAACARAAETIPLTATNVGGAHPPVIFPQSSSGVRLPSNGAGSFSGDVLLDATTSGEYVLYLSSAGIQVSVFDPDGSALSPVCGHSLPLVPAPAGYPATCALRAAYSLRLQAKRYLLRLGATASSFVRVDMIKRGNPGVIANLSSCEDTQLSSTLSNACTLALQPTPITASAFGGESPLIDSTRAYGVRFSPVGGSNEGSLSFTPTYTADYMLYVGTPNVGVAIFDEQFEQMSDGCVRPLNSQQECPALRAAFAFPRLQAGVRHQLELGPLNPQSSWVRTVVLPTAPDSDRDLLADNLDRCPHVAADRNACGCPEGCLETPIWTQEFAAQFYAQDLALDSDTNSYVIGNQGSATTALQKSSSAGSLLWTRTLEQRLYNASVATGPSGAVVVGGHTLDANSPRPFYLTKYDASGNVRWQNIIDTVVYFGERPGLAVDSGGNVLSAVPAVKVELGPEPRALVRKHDPSGNPLWSRYLVGAANEPAKARSVAAGGDGSVIVVGSLISKATGSYLDIAAFVTKLSGSGAKLWQWNEAITGPPNSRYRAQAATDVALDPNGNVFVLGEKTASSGMTDANNQVHSDVWLAKFSPTGTLLWDTIYDSGVDDAGGALAVDSMGNIAVTGSSRGSVVLPSSMWFSRYDAYGRPAAMARVSATRSL